MSEKFEAPQSVGGKARAAKLTPEERSDIAKKASDARWFGDLPEAVSEGEIKLGDVSIPCAVLEDGTRLLTQQGVLLALGRSRTAKGGQGASVDGMVPFLAAKNLQSLIPSGLVESTKPLVFRPKTTGGKAFGYRAELLPGICEVYLRARDEGVLAPSQAHVAKQADILMRALAHVGITALIDEATGYQDIRARDALAKILERFIAKELQEWTKTFPVEFYQEIFRLKGWPFDPTSVKRPAVIGHYTNNFVYARLAPGVLPELRSRNPKVDGRRRHKHFQWLTGEVGHPKLLAHIEGVKVLLRVSKTWGEFLQRLDEFYPVIEVLEPVTEVAQVLSDDPPTVSESDQTSLAQN